MRVAGEGPEVCIYRQVRFLCDGELYALPDLIYDMIMVITSPVTSLCFKAEHHWHIFLSKHLKSNNRKGIINIIQAFHFFKIWCHTPSAIGNNKLDLVVLLEVFLA